jgi:hypothetical protein
MTVSLLHIVNCSDCQEGLECREKQYSYLLPDGSMIRLSNEELREYTRKNNLQVKQPQQ